MVKSYISLTKPRICLLVLITTYLGYYIGLRSIDMFMTTSDEWLVFFHLVLGTLLSSAGACALNQAIEYKSDRKMKRTSNRAIPSGIISPKKGLLFGTILSIFGISYLLFNISILVSFLSFITIFTYIAIYTPMKKFSESKKKCFRCLCTPLAAYVACSFTAALGCLPAVGPVELRLSCAARHQPDPPYAMMNFDWCCTDKWHQIDKG